MSDTKITTANIDQHQQAAALIVKGLEAGSMTMIACLQALQAGYALGLADAKQAS